MKNIKNSVLAFAILIPVIGIAPSFDAASNDSSEDPSSIAERLVLTQTNSLLPLSSPASPERVISKLGVIITAYSSTPDQTDDTPFITASGKHVRDGIVATNLLPLGTKIKIPEIYGSKIFVVEDRMHPRMHDRIDIWFSSYSEAKKFGIKRTYIEILES